MYKLTANTGGRYSYSLLYRFHGTQGDGYGPDSALAVDAFGNLYGTTQFGGNGGGIVFQLSPGPASTYTYQSRLHLSANHQITYIATRPLISG